MNDGVAAIIKTVLLAEIEVMLARHDVGKCQLMADHMQALLWIRKRLLA